MDLDNNTTNTSRLIRRLKQANVGIAKISKPSTQNQRLYLHSSINCTCSKLVKVTYFCLIILGMRKVPIYYKASKCFLNMQTHDFSILLSWFVFILYFNVIAICN
jgi:hypothetical protein